MTNKDRVESLIGFKPGNDNAIMGALADRGLTTTDIYDPANGILVKRATIEVMNILLTTANTSDGADSWSVTYDRNAVLARIKSLSGEIGDTDGTLPVIRAVHRW